jgi:HEAT repeat protein
MVLLCFCVVGPAVAAQAQADEVGRQIARLHSSDYDVRMAAAKELGETKDLRAIQPLIAALGADVGAVAEKALVNIGAAAVEPLIAALENPDVRVREGAVRALGEIKDPRAVRPLIAALKNGNRVRLTDVLSRIGAPAVEPLVAALKNPDVQVREGSVRALGKINDPRTVRPLIAALKDADPVVRAGAARTLGEIKDPRVVEPLVAALRDPGWAVRHMAAQALGKMGALAIEPVMAALGDAHWWVRKGAAEALGESNDPRAVAALLAGWRAHDLVVIAGGCRFFIRKGEPGSEDVLVRALNAHGDVSMAQYYLNSANSKLEKAARDWAQAHGVIVISP